MRWVKHLTATRRDEKVARMISLHGYRSYGIWWAVIETVAENFDGKNPSLTYPLTTWSHLLSLRGSHVMSTLLTLGVTGVLTVERHGGDITVTIPNLLKYRDEYSRKSGHSPEIVRPKIEIQSIDTETDKPLARSALKGTRLLDDFAVTDEHREWAGVHAMPSPDDYIEEFRDYWKAKPGAGGVKLDWNATFRNWLRKAAERKNGNGIGKSANQDERLLAALQKAQGKLALGRNEV